MEDHVDAVAEVGEGADFRVELGGEGGGLVEGVVGGGAVDQEGLRGADGGGRGYGGCGGGG